MKEPGLTQDDLKLRNRSYVLNTILENAVICRRDIAKLTGLTPATVSNLTAELIACGIVEDIGCDRSASRERGGPNPILLSISSAEPYVVGLHLGSNTLEAGIVNLRGEVVAQSAMPASVASNPQSLMSLVSGLVNDLCRKQGLDLKRDLLGIGFATAGNLAEDGSIVWHKDGSLVGVAVRGPLRQLFELPVFVGNTARAMALAEAWFGKGRSYKNYLFVLVHDIVDGAIVVNRSVLVGKRHFSSLIGHSPVDNSVTVCYCGRRGCLDAVASDAALRGQAEHLARGHGSLLRRVTRGQPLTKSMIIEAAARGDEACRQLLARRGAYLGKAIARAINQVDVEAVVVAMNLAAPESDIEMGALTSAYRENLSFSDRAPDIVFSQMKRELALVGSATLVIRRVFSPELRISSAASAGWVASLPAG